MNLIVYSRSIKRLPLILPIYTNGLQVFGPDVKCWREFNAYPIDEQAARLDHKLVLTHPFPNGNGRHARLFTDCFLRYCGAQPFTWGSVNLVDASDTRAAYIEALRAADNRDYGPLLAFVRT